MPLPSPKLSEPQSRVQISGRSSATWSSRSIGPTRSVPGPKLLGLLAGADLEIAAHAGGQVDDDVAVALADALDHLPVEMDAAGALAGLRIADMAMDDGGTGGGRLERRIARSARA